MRIMTFNIQHCKNYISKQINIPAVADAIALLGAEVVVLNEVYGAGVHPAFTAQAEEIAGILGYHFYFAPAVEFENEGLYGNAFLSRFPILEARTVQVPTVPRSHPGYFEDRCAFKAVVESDEKKRYTVIGIHFGLQPEEQEQCVKTVCRLIDDSVYPVILAGDFNVHPDNPLLKPIRQRLADCKDFPGGDAPTFPSDAPKEKIDYVFCSAELTVKSVSVPQMIVSDHLPVVVDVE